MATGAAGWGAKGGFGARRVTAPYEYVPERAATGKSPVSAARGRSLRIQPREHWDEALLYRDLARLRTAADGVQIRQTDLDELRWDGALRVKWEAFCDEWGLSIDWGPDRTAGEGTTGRAGGRVGGGSTGGERGDGSRCARGQPSHDRRPADPGEFTHMARTGATMMLPTTTRTRTPTARIQRADLDEFSVRRADDAGGRRTRTSAPMTMPRPYAVAHPPARQRTGGGAGRR